VSDHPIFVPFGDQHLAAVVTVPDRTQPNNLVLLLQGAGGAPRSHRNRLWTRIAAALARQGIASIRMDYLGIGDSTGEYRFEIESPPVGQADAVLRFVAERLPVERFAIVGNCVGVPTAFQLAAGDPACAGVVAILPVALGPVLREPGSAGGRRPESSPRSGPRLLVARFRRKVAIRRRRRAPLIPEVAAVLQTGRALLLHGGTEESRRRLDRAARSAARVAGHDARLRLQVRFLPPEGGRGFRPLRMQELVVATVVDWLTAAFREPRAGGLQAPAAAEAMLREPLAQLRAGTPRAS